MMWGPRGPCRRSPFLGSVCNLKPVCNFNSPLRGKASVSLGGRYAACLSEGC